MEVKNWRYKAGCRGGGHRVTELDGDAVLHVAELVLDYMPEVSD